MRKYQDHLAEALSTDEQRAEYLTACLEQGAQGKDPLTLALLDVCRIKNVRHTEFYLDQMASILRLANKFIKHLGFKLVIQKVE